MKQRFELCIFLSNIKHILHLEETLKIINKPGPELIEILNANQKVNQTSLTILSDYIYKIYGLNFQDHIERIYYGQETCENLIPTIDNVQKALEYCIEKGYGFTFVTPYVAPKGIREVRKILEFLKGCDEEIEVVFNDFGILELLYNEFSGLKPVLGRLLTKMKRDPRFSLSGYDMADTGLKNVSKVKKNQLVALQSSGIDLSQYRQLLKEKNIERIGLDSLPQGINTGSIKKWNFKVDIYWPWTYITSGRNCAIAAYTQPGKSFHPTDEPCMFQCKSYEYTFSSDKQMLNSVQQGNAIWMNSESLWNKIIQSGPNRLIYEPYIPV
ncbi:MAG: hypothetical protein JXB24_02315 [Bacteroidales bacterium]|nr:hypothetical protein [Bacteroidales bacterium]